MNKSQKWISSTTIAIALSLLFHFGFFGTISLFPQQTKPIQSEEIVVEFVSQPETQLNSEEDEAKKARQIVEQSEDTNGKVDPNAKFLSAANQAVKEETKAANTGDFKNVRVQGAQQQSLQATRQKAEPQQKTEEQAPPTEEVAQSDTPEEVEAPAEEIKTYEGDSAVAVKKVEPKKINLKKLMPKFTTESVVDGIESAQLAPAGEGFSQRDDHLKEVKDGAQTLLNTREFVYYSYYNRIRRRLKEYWAPAIRAKLRNMMRRGRTIASARDKVTRLVIVLNQQGTLIGVRVLERSGERDLDQTAIDAFRAAAPFPNPPEGIVEEDGTIKIRWDFVLEA